MKTTILFTFLLGFTSLAFAQKGTISGTVLDKETGETMIGTAVFVVGTKVATGTDLDGSFSMVLNPGTYTVKTSFISYDDVIIENVKVTPGQTVQLKISMGEDKEELEEIVLEARAVKSNESTVLLMQKNASSVVDGISSQQIKRMGDSDAASAIKRVTGVTVEDGKYVTVRGLGDRYSKTLLNGADIPSLDPDKNAVQLDLFPTQAIDNMMVYKTFTPNLPADFTGGLINLSTKDFPDKFTVNFSGSWAFNDQSTFNKDFLSYRGGSRDWLGMDDGTRTEPENAKQLPSDIAGFVGDIDKNTAIVKSFNKTMTAQTKSPMMNQSYALSVGNQKWVGGKPLGFVVGMSYQKNNAFYNNGIVGRYTSPNPGQLIPDKLMTDAQSNEDVLWGIFADGSYKLNSRNTLGLTFMRNQGGNKVTRQLVGRWSENSAFSKNDRFYTQSLDFVERSLTTFQLKGKHNFAENKGNISWISSFSASKQDQPDFRLFAYDWEEGVGYEIKQQAYQPPTRFFRNMTQKNIDNKINYTLPFKFKKHDAEFKAGAAYLFKNRDFTEFQYDYLDNEKSFGGFQNNPDVAEQYINSSRISNFISDKNIVTGFTDPGMFMRSNRQLSNSYTGVQNVAAAYAMVKLPLGKRWEAGAGVRFERTSIEVESQNPNDDKGNVTANDFLPSLNLSYDVNEKMKMRMAVGRTLARPTFRELAPFSSYLFAGDYVLVGNPNLTRTLIDNVDLRWEFYPAIGDFISASVFYKNFTNPIERRIAPEAQNLEVSFVNVPSATLYGAEFEIRKLIPFLSNPNNQTKIGLNATYIYARTQIDSAEAAVRKEIDPNATNTRPMYGQSPFIINAFGSYTSVKHNFTFNISYNVWGERLTFVSQGRVPDVYEQSRHLVDFTLTKGIGKKWMITIKGQNLLNPNFKQTHNFNGEEFVFSQYTLGRTYSFGVRYSF